MNQICTSPDPGMRTKRLLADRRAFTLIELIVVISLISIMLVVAIPRLSGGLFSSGSGEAARWVIANVTHLKEKAVADQKIYLLNVSPDTQQLWISAADTSEVETAAARNDGYTLPREVRLDQVALSDTEQFSSGTIPIRFFPQGFSDKAVIYMRTRDGDRLAFVIEPFLPGVELIRDGRGGGL
jgi:prepilin-type N-terminal cleavage/methylation domain-containing protein